MYGKDPESLKSYKTILFPIRGLIIMIKNFNGKFFVLSDDLTGAHGVSGMMAQFGRSITVNKEALFDKREIDVNYDFLTINTESRKMDGIRAFQTVQELWDFLKVNEIGVGKRIDSTLRGNTENEIMPLLEKNSAIMTDTIPEYSRYTENGKTITSDSSIEILDKFKELEVLTLKLNELKKVKVKKGKVYVVDSRTHIDIDNIANFIYKNRYIPIDPGPLCSKVAGFYAPSKSRRTSVPKIRSMAYVIGSENEKTQSQISYAVSKSIKLRSIEKYNKEFYKAIIIRLKYIEQKHLIDDEFIEKVKVFDSLFLSGGETANSIFVASGGDFIEAINDYIPLVGIGRIHGGKLDQKIIVTKGGSIGGQSVYIDVLAFLSDQVYEIKDRH